MARERHLVQGFARIVHNLKPRMAFAFAAGSVLLEPSNRWINEVKFSSNPASIVEPLLAGTHTRVFKLSPGDRITSGALQRKSRDLTTTEHVAEYQRIYANEIEIKNRRPMLSEQVADQVLDSLENQIRSRLRRADTLCFDWAIRLRDCPQAIRRITFNDQRVLVGKLSPQDLDQVRDMVVEANSDILLAGINSMWGGDSLQIGYGTLFYLRSDSSVRDNHSRQFLRLATQLPMQSDYLRISPRRGIEHLLHSPYLMREALRIAASKVQRQSLDSSAGRSDMMEATRWIEAPKCAACPVCDLPASHNCL
jgi:hypothetical protein